MPFTLNIALVRDDVLNRLGDTSNVVWSDKEIDSYVREGYNRFCVGTGALWRRQAIGDVALQALYTLPVDLAELERATWNDEAIPPSDRSDLQIIDPRFETRTGDVTTYLLEGDGLRTLRKVGIPTVTDPNKFAVEFTRRGVAVGDRILNSLMDDWTSPLVPDGWTLLVSPTSGPDEVSQYPTSGFGGGSACRLLYAGFGGDFVGIYQDVIALPNQRRHFEVQTNTLANLQLFVFNLTTSRYLQPNGTWAFGATTLVSPSIGYAQTVIDYIVEANTAPTMLLRVSAQLDPILTPQVAFLDDVLDYPSFELHDHYIKYVRYFVLWKALEREGPGQDLGAAEHYRARYERGVGLTIAKKTAFRRAMNMSIGPAGVRGRGIPSPSWPSNFGRTIRRPGRGRR